MVEQSTPIVSVVMSIFNSEKWLKEAIDSVLNQTFGDFEFIIVDDGSTDDSLSIVRSYDDRRIKLIINESNLGVSNSVNKALQTVRGEYIARMDGDDICMPRRFERQVEFLRSHNEIDVCGSWFKVFGDSDGVVRCPQYDKEIRCMMLFNNAFAQPSVMFRKSVVPHDGILYEKNRVRVEDYELWYRLSIEHAMANIPEVLLEYRVNNKNSSKKLEAVREETHKICMRAIGDLRVELSPSEVAAHQAISENLFPVDSDLLNSASRLFKKIITANQRLNKYDSDTLNAYLAAKWWSICRSSTELGITAWRVYIGNPLSMNFALGLKARIKFIILCLIRFGRHG